MYNTVTKRIIQQFKQHLKYFQWTYLEVNEGVVGTAAPFLMQLHVTTLLVMVKLCILRITAVFCKDLSWKSI